MSAIPLESDPGYTVCGDLVGLCSCTSDDCVLFRMGVRIMALFVVVAL